MSEALDVLSSGMLCDICRVLIIGIDKYLIALRHDPRLAVQILLKVRMLRRTYMVIGNVGKYAVVVAHPVYAMHLDRLT